MPSRASRVGMLAVTASLAIGVGASPALAQTSTAERRQNTAIKKNTSTGKRNTTAIRKTNTAVRRAANNIKSLQAAGTALATLTGSLDTDRTNLNNNLIPTFVKALTDLRDGLTAAGAGLTALKDGLTALSTAVQDPVTGLVGLNNARPKFAIVSGGAFAGGTPGLTAGSVTRVDTGVYIINFGQDVSKRAPQLSLNSVATARLGAASGAITPIGQILNCGGSATTMGACNAVLAGSGTVNHALVTIKNAQDNTPQDFTFTATEIAG